DEVVARPARDRLEDAAGVDGSPPRDESVHERGRHALLGAVRGLDAELPSSQRELPPRRPRVAQVEREQARTAATLRTCGDIQPVAPHGELPDGCYPGCAPPDRAVDDMRERAARFAVDVLERTA